MRFAFILALAAAACGDDDGGGGVPDGGVTLSRVQSYIRPAPYPKLVVEIDAIPGFTPRPASSEAIRQELGELLGKPGGVTVMQATGLTSRGADHAWFFSELEALADATFDLAVDADTIKMHVLFLDGHYYGDTANQKILGVAWGNTHLAMFKQTIEETCAAAAGLNLFKEQMCQAAEQSIWLHELGHVIGLVGNGLAMAAPHADPAHAGHDASDGCVMYWAYEGGGAVDALLGRFLGGNQEALGFDAACLADIDAAR